jgi:hypothetical protein
MPPMPDQGRVPALLMPGQSGQYRHDPIGLPQTHSYEDLPGARSPAESEASNFTSVSQRGVNPNWRPGNGGGGEFNSFAPMRRPNPERHMRRDVLLQGNPDFEIPGMAPMNRGMSRGRGRGGGGGMRGGMMGAPRMPPASAVGAGADGRYPMGPPPMSGPGGMREI